VVILEAAVPGTSSDIVHKLRFWSSAPVIVLSRITDDRVKSALLDRAPMTT